MLFSAPFSDRSAGANAYLTVNEAPAILLKEGKDDCPKEGENNGRIKGSFAGRNSIDSLVIRDSFLIVRFLS